MAPGHLVTVEIRDADLIFPQTLTMSMREVPSCYGSHANNTTKGSRSRSIISVTNPTCQPTINMSQFIAKQVPYQPDLYLKHEAKCQEFVVRYEDDGIPFEINSSLLLRQNNYHGPPIQIT